MPQFKDVSKEDQAKYERCLKHVKGDKKYPICYKQVIAPARAKAKKAKSKKKPRSVVPREFDYEVADALPLEDGSIEFDIET